MCTYFMGKDTIDERIYDLIMEKNTIANAVTGATDSMDMQIVDRMASIFSDL
jgi:SWI/SNF-related matrix-associated actin-dependent regulator 1 of chromatin subfamily A